MNPRIYYKAPNKHGVQCTSAHKQRDYRRAVKLGMTMKEFRKHENKRVDRMYAFYRAKDYGRAAVAFKQAMQEFHPDHGGDHDTAARIIAAWDAHKKLHGWTGPAPSVTGTK